MIQLHRKATREKERDCLMRERYKESYCLMRERWKENYCLMRERERVSVCYSSYLCCWPKTFFFSKGPKLVIWILSNVVTASTNPAEVNGGDSFNAWNRGWNLNRPISNKQSRSITTSNWVKISQQWIQVQLYEIRVLKDFFKKIK